MEKQRQLYFSLLSRLNKRKYLQKQFKRMLDDRSSLDVTGITRRRNEEMLQLIDLLQLLTEQQQLK